MSVALLLLLLLMMMMSMMGQVAAFPVPAEATTYSSVADIGTLANGAAGFVGQLWNTGARLGGEFIRRGFGFLGVA
uniref:Putative secreted protein n=1 Tax=Anopheles darlingi TaxID=43151 RepID=A0A2M4DPD3_ANODA